MMKLILRILGYDNETLKMRHCDWIKVQKLVNIFIFILAECFVKS